MLFARTLTRNPADAEDLVQEALTKAMCNWEAFELGSNLQAWLNRIVKNLFLDKMKSHAEIKTESVGDDTSRLDKTTNSGPEATLVAEQVHDFMFLHMPEKERSIVLLWAEGFSYEEIAQSMGITRSNAGVLLCRHGSVCSINLDLRQEIRVSNDTDIRILNEMATIDGEP